jgi:hypothetical protein
LMTQSLCDREENRTIFKGGASKHQLKQRKLDIHS